MVLLILRVLPVCASGVTFVYCGLTPKCIELVLVLW